MPILTCIGGPTGTPFIRKFVVVPDDVGEAGLLNYYSENKPYLWTVVVLASDLAIRSILTCAVAYRQAEEKNPQRNFQMTLRSCLN